MILGEWILTQESLARIEILELDFLSKFSIFEENLRCVFWRAIEQLDKDPLIFPEFILKLNFNWEYRSLVVD